MAWGATSVRILHELQRQPDAHPGLSSVIVLRLDGRTVTAVDVSVMKPLPPLPTASGGRR